VPDALKARLIFSIDRGRSRRDLSIAADFNLEMLKARSITGLEEQIQNL
jgi:hypothetical protein